MLIKIYKNLIFSQNLKIVVETLIEIDIYVWLPFLVESVKIDFDLELKRLVV